MRHSGTLALFILLLLTLAPMAVADEPTPSDDSLGIAGWFQDVGEFLNDFWKSLTTAGNSGSDDGHYYTTENTNDLGGGNDREDDFGPYSDPSGGRER